MDDVVAALRAWSSSFIQTSKLRTSQEPQPGARFLTDRKPLIEFIRKVAVAKLDDAIERWLLGKLAKKGGGSDPIAVALLAVCQELRGVLPESASRFAQEFQAAKALVRAALRAQSEAVSLGLLEITRLLVEARAASPCIRAME